MKKLILLWYLLFVVSFIVKAQQWKPYKIDDSVQVSLPPGYKVSDTLGQKVISATTSFGAILIVKSPDDPARTPDIEKEKQLDNFYKNYLQKIRGSSESTILDEKDTTIKNLIYKDFTLQVDSGSGKQIRNFRIVHVNSATYTFEFLYQDIHKEYAVSEKDRLFNSIRIPPDASLQSQFTSPENTTGEPPTGNNTYMTGGIVLLVVIIVVVIVIRRRKRSG